MSKVSVKKPWTITIRSILLWISLGIVCFSLIIILLLSFYAGLRAVDDVADQLRGEMNARITSHVDHLLEVPLRIISVNDNLFSRGIVNFTDQWELMNYFWEQVQLFPRVTSIYFGNTQGGLANAQGETDYISYGDDDNPDGYTRQFYHIYTENFTSGVFRKFLVNQSGEHEQLVTTIEHFDARHRPWYIDALGTRDSVWTKPYVLFTGDNLAITLSKAVYSDENGLLGVVALDVFLDQISNFLETVNISQNSRSFIVDDQGYLIASSRGDSVIDVDDLTREVRRVSLLSSENPVFQAAHPLIFENNKNDPEYLISSLENGDLKWKIVTYVPLSDYLARVYNTFFVVLGLVGAILLGIVVFTLLLTIKISKPIIHLTEIVQTLSQGEWVEPNPRKSRIYEIRVLTQRFTEMSHTLRMMVNGLNREILERKEIQEQLVLAKNQAEQASQAKSQFLANMSHEIRTPLNAVIGFTDLLSETELDSVQFQYIRSANTAGHDLLSILGDVLDFSKIEAGKLELEAQPTELSSLFIEILEIYQHQSREKNIELIRNLDPNLPFKVLVDPFRLKQVLVNLLNNALKFTSEGWVELKVGCVKSTNSLVVVHFEISDTGIGIEKQNLDQLFHAFTQADASTTRKYGGTGLGLVISQQLVQKMGGTILARSKFGSGSGFSFDLELEVLEWEGKDVEKSDNPTPVSNYAFPRSGGYTILVVEDIAINMVLVKAMMSKILPEATIIEAMSGAIGVKLVENQTFDLIFMDIQMPEMDGLEATKEIRKNEVLQNRPRVPIIALTAGVLKEERTRCLEAGMDDYLSKPLYRETLAKVLHRWLPKENGMDIKNSILRTYTRQNLVDRLQGDEETAAEICTLFFTDFPPIMEELRIAAGDMDFVTLGRTAHRIKGSAGSIGAKDFSDAALELEVSARDGLVDGVAQAVLLIEEKYREVYDALSEKI